MENLNKDIFVSNLSDFVSTYLDKLIEQKEAKFNNYIALLKTKVRLRKETIEKLEATQNPNYEIEKAKFEVLNGVLHELLRVSNSDKN